MTPTVSDIIGIMESLAPRWLAESWDNVGLQVGDPQWPVETVWLALDPLPETVAAAVSAGAQMLITHHPLLFRPLSSVDVSTPVGTIVYTAMAHRLAIFSAHTNLDSVTGGINDILAGRLGLDALTVLGDEKQAEAIKLAVFVPQTHETAVLEALVTAGAGCIGDYSGCTFRSVGKGTFTPGSRSRPYLGQPGRFTQVDEVRIETRVTRERLAEVVTALRKAHPYETMAFDLYPMQPHETGQGIGRVGLLDPPQTLDAFAEAVRCALGLPTVRVVGDGAMTVNRVAVCSGSGGGLMSAVFASGAQVYVTGDLRYHDARDAQARGVGLIDIGHFASEHLVIDPLADRLAAAIAEAGWSIAIKTYDAESDPFRVLSS
ncbi:MAG: Nif3-like dinuclear metal center hexameric protein [Desulfobacterales bacterium]|nr:Nif3-like dinuclear metal center hexameric protein [Desulfobacterales bacterium]